MIRAQSGQTVGAQLVNATTGAAFSGVVTVYVTGDAGTQAIGSVGSGLCTDEGNGLYTYTPAQTETDYDLVAFTFIGTDAIPKTQQYEPLTLAQATALSLASAPNAITVRKLITRALKRIGICGAGQTPAPEDMEDAFGHLNTMLDAFALQRLLIPCIERTTWTIVSGTGSYTVGDGGDVDIARPVYVEDVKFIDTSLTTPYEYSIGMLTDQGYANIPMKTFESPYPTNYYWNPTYSGVGLAVVTFYPIPTSSTLQGVIYAPTALTQVASVNTTLTLQPGYRYFLQEALAEFLAPEFGVPVPDQIKANVAASRADIKRGNMRIREQATIEGAYFGGRGMVYNIFSDS